jgi:hypothetical protein
MTAVGHEDAFPPRRLSGRCGSRKQSLAVEDESSYLTVWHFMVSRRQVNEPRREALRQFDPAVACAPSCPADSHSDGLSGHWAGRGTSALRCVRHRLLRPHRAASRGYSVAAPQLRNVGSRDVPGRVLHAPPFQEPSCCPSHPILKKSYPGKFLYRVGLTSARLYSVRTKDTQPKGDQLYFLGDHWA